MKFAFGSLIISFGIIFVVVVLLISVDMKLTNSMLKYLGIAWIVLAIATYPLAKKLIRD